MGQETRGAARGGGKRGKTSSEIKRDGENKSVVEFWQRVRRLKKEAAMSGAGRANE